MPGAIQPDDWLWLKEACVRASAGERKVVLAECSEKYPDLAPMLRQMISDYDAAGETPLLSWLDYPQTEVHTFASGELISQRYQIESCLGRGGMGEVYEVTDNLMRDRGSIALKTVRSDLARNREAATRFEREVRNSLAVAHPNVCRIFDVGRHWSADGPVLYLTMEYLPGVTLAKWLSDRKTRENPLTEEEALPLIRQMAEGLAAIHSRRIIHRDFKPGNVMLVEDAEGRRAVITDFGLSRGTAENQDQDMTQLGAAIGTPAFMAPEQLSGEGPLSSAVDVYALGVTIHEMLTGRRYEPGAPLTALEAAPLSQWLRAMVRRCLERDKQQRYADAGEVVAEIEAGPRRQTVQLPVSRVTLWAGIASVLILSSAVGGWLVLRDVGEPVPPGVRALVDQASSKIVNNSFHDAGTLLEQATAKAPHFAMAHAMLADAYNGQELVSKANREVIRAIDSRDLSASSADERAYIEGIRLTMGRDYPAAAEQFRRYYDRASPEQRPDRAVLLGRALEMARKPDEAAELYQSAGNRGAALLALAVMDAREARLAQARARFEAARALFGNQSDAVAALGVDFSLGAALLRWGDPGAAKTTLKGCAAEARRINDIYDALLCEQQLSVEETGADRDTKQIRRDLEAQMDEADRMGFSNILARDHLYLGTLLVRTGDNPGAEKQFATAQALAENQESLRLKAQAQYAFADLLNRTGRSEESEPLARAALAFYDNDRSVREIAECVITLARSLRNQGKIPEARNALASKSALLPALAPAQRQLMMEASASIDAAEENYPAARKAYGETLLISSTNNPAYYELATARLDAALGRLSDAGAEVQRVTRRSGLAWFYMNEASAVEGDIALFSGNSGAAERSYGRYKGMTAKARQGLAEIRSGKTDEGLEACQSAMNKESGAESRARLCVLEGLAARKDAGGAEAVYDLIGTSWKPQMESAWRADALMASVTPADPKVRAAALLHLETLRAKWGEDAFRSYLTRPDVRSLLLKAGLKI